MPITKQAVKKLRRDRRAATRNAIIKRELKEVIKKFRKKPSGKALTVAFSKLDIAVKKRVIHANKASRLKSRLARSLSPK
ncbi:hypothetical protein A2154_04215 [Candidatus Gottesmanbacteria bacterium RBG_16_43_7]|uniref:Small ribosomal subunit protein bS20 n=1 Tax=Candidatus Gottesmanbacteria bacterium RBG_16_43_7 TaxID=1798373 RepID=A0A1F5Z985_9BACT|nr:MAG: hypothetical protein A2154_04215 [Candidatus Gottesmanbacteria bacterium RBG_16_43_7]